MAKKTKIISIILVLTILVVCVAKYQEIYAYFTTKASKTNSFKFGEVIATVAEPNYKNNQILKPKEEIEKIGNGFDKINDVGIKCINYKFFLDIMIKVLILDIIFLIR